jgi:cellulose synthase (UDP-forming)
MSAIEGVNQPSPGGILSAPAMGARLRVTSPRQRHRYLVPVMPLAQRVPLLVSAVAWFAAAFFFARWWLTPGNTTSIAGLLVNSAVLGVELLVLPSWFLFFLLRMKRPNPALPLPSVRVAMVVTKAPSEPWSVARKTLQGMLDQDYPAPYDVWLADEDPTREVANWCARHGVQLSTRRGAREYHRPSWPRRTRCKEGNLAYFYDFFGYDRYDVVAQLDADHVPEPGYLQAMVAPFIDPDVGYVAAPSICDSNADRSWSARGRLFVEAVLHGPTQAGASGDYAPSCIGSHYAVRTSALREIGGLGPELAEDFSTTLMMTAGGWRGAFAIDAIAHGEGPECVADCVLQDFQWARSMTNILLRFSPTHWHNLTLRAKIKLGFCQLWYPLNGVTMLAMVLLPVWSLASHEPLMRVSLGDFYLHMLPSVAVGLAAMLWCKHKQLLRPVDGRPVSWEALLFQFVRWPWAFLGVLQSCAGALTGREFGFAVTPKGSAEARPLPTRVLAPYLILATISLAPALLIKDAGAASGYYFWSLVNGAIYLGVAVAIVALHARENPRHVPLRRRLTILASPKALALQAVTAAVLAAGGLHGAEALAVLSAPPSEPMGRWAQLVGVAPQLAGTLAPVSPAPSWVLSPNRANDPFPIGSSPRGPLQIGVTTTDLASSVAATWGTPALRQLNAFEWEIHAHASIVMWYVDWKHDALTLNQLRQIGARGSTPEITWEPWNALLPTYHRQPAYSMARIAAGKDDAYVRAFALRLRKYGRPVLLRFAQEMNGGWYPWGTGRPTQFNTPAEFVAAWRHLHDVFAAVGATNVRWVWSPVESHRSTAALYPGDRYVDVLGVSGFNGGASLRWGGWQSFGRLFDGTLTRLHQLAPTKPIQISETASAERGGDKAEWIRQMFTQLGHRPYVKSLIWFDDAKQTAWPLDSSRAAMSAFAAGLRSLSRH